MLEAGLFVTVANLALLSSENSDEDIDDLASYTFGGVVGQLVELTAEGKWLIALPQGRAVVEERDMQVLESAAIPPSVVLGPLSSVPHAAGLLAERVEIDGYGSAWLFDYQQHARELREAILALQVAGKCQPLHHEMQESYLGEGGNQSVAFFRTSGPLSSEWSQLITKHAEAPPALNIVTRALLDLLVAARGPLFEQRGIDIAEVSPLMLRMPCVLEPSEGLDAAQPVRIGHPLEYLHIKRRGQLLVLMFIGPGEARLILSQRATWQRGAHDVTKEVLLDPFTMVLVDIERFDYSLEAAASNWSVLQLWCLTAQPSFQLHGELPEALLGNLHFTAFAPKCPEGRQACIASAANKYAISSSGMHQYWQAIARAGGDGACVMPSARWDYLAYYDPDPDNGNGSNYYCKHFSVVEGIELFDHAYFNISANEAATMDPSQRLVLEVGAIALQEAGYARKELQKRPQNIGVFVGSDHYDWKELGMLGVVPQGTTGSVPSILANRFSFCMNCRGPSFALDSACSASLVGTHAAKLHLLYKDRIPAMLSVGVMTIISPIVFMGNCQAGMLSKDGRCFTFNDTANGFLRCEAIGGIVMKNEVFSSAEHHCLISASNSNQDGRSASLTAPSGPAQVECLLAVLEENNISPNEVDLTECHGTGTALGDPIEMGSVRKVFDPGKRYPPRLEPFLMGSVKSNHGHAEGGAGLTGLMKCMLQVMHQEASAGLHIRCINPHVDLEGFPMLLPQETNPVRGDSCYAGVTGMGFGGTNAHVQVWGTNTMTSRRQFTRKSVQNALLRRLYEQNLPDIETDGHWQTWLNYGIDPAAKPGDQFYLDVSTKASTIRLQKVNAFDREESLYDLSYFGVRGSFNGWEVQPLVPHKKFNGLWSGVVSLGGRGRVEIQIIADSREDRVFGPHVRSSSMLTEMLGPAGLPQDQCWVVSGQPYADVMLEFHFRPEGSRSLTWQFLTP